MPHARKVEGVHLTCDGLARLVAGELDPKEGVELVKHLVHGCRRCCSLLGPLAGMLLPPEPDAPEQGDEDRYEVPVARAIAAAHAAAKDLALSRISVRLDLARILTGLRTGEELTGRADAVREGLPEERWAWCELLVEVACERRAHDPWEAAELADMAVALAEDLAVGPAPYLPEALADLQAHTWMELGNLLRTCQDLVGAESALAKARGRLVAGTGNPLLTARLLDLAGSLYRARRRFPEALEVLESAGRLYSRCGEKHRAGRVMVKTGLVQILAGEPERAIDTLEQALTLLDFRTEPSMLLAVVHNRLLALVDAGRPEQAARALWRSRAVYELGTELDRVKLLGLEGLLAAALGQAKRAERFFRDEKAGFQRAGFGYDAALVSLDLAGVLLEQGNSGEVLGLVDEMLETFRELRIAREAVATVLLLRKALRQGEATAALARQVASELRRLVPSLPFRPSIAEP